MSAQNCNSDFIVFGLTVNTGTQANVVGVNNLDTEASPACNGGTPWVAFAYNTVTHTGGQIRTSPTLSGDGKKVAFVESTTTGSYFHVLVLPSPIPTPPAQTGTVLSPSTPSSCTTPTTASRMTTVQISTASNTDSSVWVDYSTDITYVGTDDGKLYKISPVFGGGAPAYQRYELARDGGHDWNFQSSHRPDRRRQYFAHLHGRRERISLRDQPDGTGPRHVRAGGDRLGGARRRNRHRRCPDRGQ